jgi:hypothetical protein
VLGEEVEQDRQLGLVVEITGDDLERIRVENREQLVVGQAQQVLKLRGLQNSWFFSRRDGLYRPVTGSIGFAGITGTPDTLLVAIGRGRHGSESVEAAAGAMLAWPLTLVSVDHGLTARHSPAR